MCNKWKLTRYNLILILTQPKSEWSWTQPSLRDPVNLKSGNCAFFGFILFLWQAHRIFTWLTVIKITLFLLGNLSVCLCFSFSCCFFKATCSLYPLPPDWLFHREIYGQTLVFEGRFSEKSWTDLIIMRWLHHVSKSHEDFLLFLEQTVW